MATEDMSTAPNTAPDAASAPAPAPAAAPVAIFKKRATKSKSNLRKRTTPPPQDSDDDYSSSEDEAGHKIKRRKRNTGAVTASSTAKPAATSDIAPTIHAADRSGITSANDATKSSDWFDVDNQTSESKTKNLLGSTRAMPSAPDGTYKGLAAQKETTFLPKNPDAPPKAIGPMRAPANVRTITVTDYAPDVCKDYKQTGFCGFGDGCKFLHAREDYKAGWQLDREWENVTKGKKNLGGTKVASAGRRRAGDDDEEEDEESMLEGIPFACIICREGYKHPIVTRCGHYFCEACALKRYRKDPTCAACGSGTGGVFNVAKNLKKLLDRKREMSAQRREKAREAGEEVSSEEEEE